MDAMKPNWQVFMDSCEKAEVKPLTVFTDLKISTSSLSYWRNGKCFPKYDKIAMIADYLDVPVGDFYV